MRNYYQSRIYVELHSQMSRDASIYGAGVCFLVVFDAGECGRPFHARGYLCWKKDDGGFPVDKNTGSVGHDAVRNAVQRESTFPCVYGLVLGCACSKGYPTRTVCSQRANQ